MATNESQVKYGTQLLFADHATDFGAAPATAAHSLIVGTPTDVQMNLSVLANTAMWQSAKTASLARTGSAWAQEWVFGACMEGAATPTAGATYDFYWNSSPNSTAASGNSGGCSGTDATYTADSLNQLTFIGSLVCAANVININASIGVLRMNNLYGSLVIDNNSGVAMVDTVADNIHFTLTPIIPDLQAAA